MLLLPAVSSNVFFFFRDNYTALRAEIQLQCSAEVLVR